MFPISYVEITEPISKESPFNQEMHKVIAVFAFKPECWEDLSIEVIIKTNQYHTDFSTIKYLNNGYPQLL